MSQKQKRYAYLIGANGPENMRLKYAEQDVLRLVKAFNGKYCDFTRTEYLVAEKRDKTLEGLEQLAQQCEPSDLLIVHFSGHAIYYYEELYLLCNNTDIEKNLEASAIDISAIKRIIRRCRAKHKLLVLDCCHAGAALHGGFKSNQRLEEILHEAARGSASGVLAACSRSKRTRELDTLDGGAGFLSWAVAVACTSRFREVSSDDISLSLDDLWRWMPLVLKEVNRTLPEENLIPQPILWSEKEGDGQIYLTPLKQNEFRQARYPKQSYERDLRLKAMLSDHQGFIRDRLESFVGRQAELEIIKQRISEKLQTGGYVTITGQAGQGKSSIIAKLVHEHIEEDVAHHFIPFNPGPDHQVILLRDLMARLILKHNLSDLYVASESRVALRDYFPKILLDIAEKREQEVIFIDGLDQLKEDWDGERDLSFLPNDPPKGIVFVLGTRPNDTLRPLKLLKPHNEYQLPNLDRQDFDRILKRRGVLLERGLVDEFYMAMQENALYLDLVAKELAEGKVTNAPEMIKRIANNPNSIFSIAMARLKRHAIQWREVVKPILGVLLAAREPLAVQHIRQILMIEDDQLREGVERLGGLVSRDGQRRCYLFHLKLQEYLRQDDTKFEKEYIFATDEEEGWHKRLADWCEVEDLKVIWQDMTSDTIKHEKHLYARRHYISHLYYARSWPKLFSVLDEDMYGRAKVRDDPSTRSYIQDLILGQQAAAWERGTTDFGLESIPQLWRYTLLRCSLTSRADQYPLEAFDSLVLLKRVPEAIGLAELLTQPGYKARALLQIVKQLKKQEWQGQERLQLLVRSYELTKSIEEQKAHDTIMNELCAELIQMEQWELAEAVIKSSRNLQERVNGLRLLIIALTQMQQWERAKGVAKSIDEATIREQELGELSVALAKAHQWELAEEITLSIESTQRRIQTLQCLSIASSESHQWVWAEKTAKLIDDFELRNKALGDLSIMLTEAHQWEIAEEVAWSIEDTKTRIQVLIGLSAALAEVQQWRRAEEVAKSIEDSQESSKALLELGLELIEAQQWEQAEEVAKSLEDRKLSDKILGDLGIALVAVQRWEQAEGIIKVIKATQERANVLCELGSALAKAQQWERAKKVAKTLKEPKLRDRVLGDLGIVLVEKQQWKQVEEILQSVKGTEERTRVLGELGVALAQAQQWERAEEVASSLNDVQERTRVLGELGVALAQARQWERAEEVASSLNDVQERTKILSALIVSLAQAQQWLHALRKWEEIEESRNFSYEVYEGRITVICELAKALANAQEWEKAVQVWLDAWIMVSMTKGNEKCLITLCELDRKLMDAHRENEHSQLWTEINERLAYDNEDPIGNLYRFGRAFVKDQQLERAEELWEEAKAWALDYDDSEDVIRGLYRLGKAFAEDQQLERAEEFWKEVEEYIYEHEDSEGIIKGLYMLGRAFAEDQQLERAEKLWEEAKVWVLDYDDSESIVRGLYTLSEAFSEDQQWEYAKKLLRLASGLIWTIEDEVIQTELLSELTGITPLDWQDEENGEGILVELVKARFEIGKVFKDQQEWNNAKEEWRKSRYFASLIENTNTCAIVLSELGKELFYIQEYEEADIFWEDALRVILDIENSQERARMLFVLVAILAQAQQWERAEHLWAQAKELVWTIESYEERTMALIQLAKALTEVKQQEQAETVWDLAEFVAGKIELQEEQTIVLIQLGIALAEMQMWEHAKSIWSKIENGKYITKNNMKQERIAWRSVEEDQEDSISEIDNTINVIQALSRFGATLLLGGCWEQVLSIAGVIVDPGVKAEILQKVCLYFAKERLWENLEGTLQLLKKPMFLSEERGESVSLIVELTGLVAQQQKWKYINVIIQITRKKWTRSEVFIELAAQLIRIQQRQQAEAILKEAEAVINSIQDIWVKSVALGKLAKVFAETRHWEKAMEIIALIENKPAQADVLINVGNLLFQQQKWKQAETIWINAENIVYSISDRLIKITMLKKLAISLFQAKLIRKAEVVWREAEVIANTIPRFQNRMEAFCELCNDFLKTQQWWRAKALARKIENNTLRTEVLMRLVTELTKLGDWEQAKTIWLETKETNWANEMPLSRMETLIELGAMLVKVGKPEEAKSVCLEAEALAYTIEEFESRVHLLKKIAVVLGKANADEQMLRLVQRPLLQVTSREAALKLLPLNTELIPRNPKIGNAMYEAFSWVDNFLKN